MSPILPINYDTIRIALVSAVQSSTGLTCITMEGESHGNPRPNKPYFGFKIINPGIKIGDDSASSDGVTTISTRAGQRQMVVDFNCYGRSHEEAYGYMILWQSLLETETMQAILRESGIAVWLDNGVNDLSQLLNTGFEGRAHMEVTFGIASNITEDLGTMETINANGIAETDQLVSNNINVQVKI